MKQTILRPEIAPQQAAGGQKKLPYRNMLDEADIGSGEKTPGQEDTERFIRTVPLKQADAAAAAVPAPQADPNADPNVDPEADPEAEQVGTAHSLVDQLAEEQAIAELSLGSEDDLALDRRAHERRMSIEQDEPDSLLDDQDPVPPKGN